MLTKHYSTVTRSFVSCKDKILIFFTFSLNGGKIKFISVMPHIQIIFIVYVKTTSFLCLVLGFNNYNYKLYSGGSDPKGKDKISRSGHVVGTCWSFDPVTRSWFSLASLNTPRKNFGIVADLNYIYVIGGIDKNQR